MGSNIGFEGVDKCFFLLAPRGACKCLENGEPLFGSPGDVFHVGAESKGGVECHPQYLGVLFEGEGFTIDGDIGVSVTQLPSLGAEKGNGGFLCGDLPNATHRLHERPART